MIVVELLDGFGVKSSRYLCGRSVLKHTTHSAVASSAWFTPRALSADDFVLNDPTVVSANALSRGSWCCGSGENAP